MHLVKFTSERFLAEKRNKGDKNNLHSQNIILDLHRTLNVHDKQ